MKTPRIAGAVGHIDDDLVCAAAHSRKSKPHPWVKWGSLAACLAVLLLAGAAVLPSFWGGEETVPPEKTDRLFKDVTIRESESAVVWPWEYKTVYEKYVEIAFDGQSYSGQGREIGAALVGEKLGTCEATGYAEMTDELFREEFDVHRIVHVSPERLVAVNMEGKYYVFLARRAAPPQTLGEAFELYGLPHVLELHRFSENGDDADKAYFALNEDAYIWEVLAACRDAGFVDPQSWQASDRDYISFTVTSEALGVYKKALYVTRDGYVWTNAFDRAFLYFIGEAAAGRILTYAAEHSTEAAYESYTRSIAGTVTGITGEYILVDDAIRCVDPADGIVFRVPLDDLRIRRYVKAGMIQVGDTVVVHYEGEIDATAGHLVTGAVSVSAATISDGDVRIAE